jgi:hypothetical protein
MMLTRTEVDRGDDLTTGESLTWIGRRRPAARARIIVRAPQLPKAWGCAALGMRPSDFPDVTLIGKC